MHQQHQPTKTACEKAVEILGLTADGDNLDPAHLKLVESAVNNFLTEAGKQAFTELHQQVMAGEYRKPWVAGVEHITRNLNGYIFWKGEVVEHFTFSHMSAEKVQECCVRLSAACVELEKRSQPVSWSAVSNMIDELFPG